MIVDSAAPSADRASRTAWWTFVGVAVMLLPLMVSASFDFGVTWDEKARHKYGEMIWEYLRGLRSRADFAEDGGHLYGGLFDTIAAAIERFVPADRYVVRHALNAIFGWAGIVYAGRLAAQLFGRWAGVVAMLLLAASPRYFADSMNNPKDLPFAAVSVAALFYISRVAPTWPYVSGSIALPIVLSLAIALNIRSGALMYLGYFGLLVMGYTLIERRFTWRRTLDTIARLAAVSVAVLLLGTVFWPWAQGSPIWRPIEALLGFANFPYVAGMLYGGTVITSDALPVGYAPWWFAITTPPVVLAGALVASTLGLRDRFVPLSLLWVVAILPVALAVALHSTLYDGVRHLLFVYPVLVVVAAWGWTWVMAAPRPIWMRRVAAGLLVAGFADAIAFQIRSFPNQAAYFNQLVGGPSGAFARYEMDYWGNCLLEAVHWTADTAQRSGMPLIVSGEPWQVIQLDAGRFRQLAFDLPYRGNHHLDLRLARGSAEMIRGLATRPDLLYKVQTADGAVLCVVVPGPAFGHVQPRLKLP